MRKLKLQVDAFLMSSYVYSKSFLFVTPLSLFEENAEMATMRLAEKRKYVKPEIRVPDQGSVLIKFFT